LCQTVIDGAQQSFIELTTTLQELEKKILCQQFATNWYATNVVEGEDELMEAEKDTTIKHGTF
jgi:hypothetical protein